MRRCLNFLGIVIGLLILLSGCTPQKKLVYLRDAETGIQETGRQFKYVLRKGDVLSVSVYSVNEQASKLFSPQRGVAVNVSSDIGAYLHGFVVNDSGEVNLPLIGKLRVSDMTLEQAASVIEENVKEYFFDAIVDVKLLSFQITVLGEVNRPGTYKVAYPRINIFEAIGLAGDLNVYGKRDITLVRETPDGYELFKMDLKDKNLMSHECFYLLPNDIIYIEPHKAKMFGFSTVPITLLFTTISSLILIMNFVNN